MWTRFRSFARVLAPFALAVPLAVAVDIPEDSTVTEVRVAAGAGTYLAVTRDCSGDIIASEPVDFSDVGVSIEHLRGRWGFGLDAGYLDDARPFFDYTNSYPPELRTSDTGYYYLSPDLQISTRKIGATLGFLYTTAPLPSNDDTIDEDRSGAHLYPTASLRVGNPSSVYISAHLFSMSPVYSGGDYAAVGVGALPTPWCRLWGGLGSGGLYSNGGAIIQGDFQVARGLWLGVNTRYGDEDNYGVGLSVAYRWMGR